MPNKARIKMLKDGTSRSQETEFINTVVRRNSAGKLELNLSDPRFVHAKEHGHHHPTTSPPPSHHLPTTIPPPPHHQPTFPPPAHQPAMPTPFHCRRSRTPPTPGPSRPPCRSCFCRGSSICQMLTGMLGLTTVIVPVGVCCGVFDMCSAIYCAPTQ